MPNLGGNDLKQNIYDDPTFFQKYKQLRQSATNYNHLLEQPVLKQMLPPLAQLTILDIGCGMGGFAKYCIEQEATKVIGIDISEKMIEEAKRVNHDEHIEYIHAALEDVQLTENSFDLVVSSLALHYIKDYQATISKISSSLKTGGHFVFSIEHPIVTARKATDNWIENSSGERLFYAIDDYQFEGERQIHWYIDGVIKYHRTFSTIINTLIENGLQIEKVIEPAPDEYAISQLPGIRNELRKPSFLMIKAKKN